MESRHEGLSVTLSRNLSGLTATLPGPGCAPQRQGTQRSLALHLPRESVGAATGRRPCFEVEPTALGTSLSTQAQTGVSGEGRHGRAMAFKIK